MLRRGEVADVEVAIWIGSDDLLGSKGGELGTVGAMALVDAIGDPDPFAASAAPAREMVGEETREGGSGASGAAASGREPERDR